MTRSADSKVTAIRANREVEAGHILSGTEVHARIHCGYQPLGYVVLYGAWEFLCEKLFYYL